MSVRAITWVLGDSQSTGTARLAMLTLADQMSVHGDETVETCWPSVGTIAQRMRVSPRTAQRALADLVELGEITAAPFAEWQGRADRRPNVYALVAEAESRGDNLSPRTDDGVTTGATTGCHPCHPIQVLDPELEPSCPEPDGSRREDVETLCSILASSMIERGLRPPTISKAWRKSARLLLDRDRVSLPTAERVLRWTINDDFWSLNVLSLPTFREKFDRLLLQSNVTPIRRNVEESDEWRLMQPGAIKVRP